MPQFVSNNQLLDNGEGRPGGGRKRSVFSHGFEEIISLENLLEAWKEFLRGKRKRKDVQEFSLNLMDNILQLHQDLAQHTYNHGPYQAFRINDPKPRQIHKSSVRDRLLHHAIYRILYPFFDRTFMADSFSCRIGKGTHKALNRFRKFGQQISRNHTLTGWALQCDIKKFFENINHEILRGIFERYIPNENTKWLLGKVIDSFSSAPGRGLPLGNLTSQLFVNIYMNEFDQFMKHQLKTRCYLRYADDFVILFEDKSWLEELLPKISDFLEERLRLELHPNKISIKTLASGVDFLGWIHFSDHRIIRTVIKRRMLRKLKLSQGLETFKSYLGLLRHGHTHKLRQKVFDFLGIEKS